MYDWSALGYQVGLLVHAGPVHAYAAEHPAATDKPRVQNERALQDSATSVCNNTLPCCQDVRTLEQHNAQDVQLEAEASRSSEDEETAGTNAALRRLLKALRGSADVTSAYLDVRFPYPLCT